MDKPNNTPPPWSEAPPWANWIGQNKDGDWYAFSHKPTVTSNGFTFGYRLDVISRRIQRGSINPNWKTTLQKRPENE